MNLMEHFIHEQEVLKAHYESTNQFRAPSVKGIARELFVKEFLDRHLPKWLYHARGEVVCSKGMKPSEQDLVIYRPDIPHFELSRDRELLLLEGVLATIEVKSKLEKKELRKAIRKVAEIKRMQRLKPVDSFKREQPMKQEIKCLIFAYDGTKFQSCRKAFYEITKEDGIEARNRPDYICVLGKYSVIKNDGFLLKKRFNEEYVVKTRGDVSLLTFFFYLHYSTSQFIGTSYEIKGYLPEGDEAGWGR